MIWRLLVVLCVLIGLTGAAGAAGFTVSGGQILTSSGTIFSPRGVDIYDSTAESVLGSSATPLTTIFPAANILPVYVFSYATPSTYAAFVNEVTSAGIVVVFVNNQNFFTDGTSAGNSGGGCGDIFSGSILTTESNWYASMASFYASNPYVWFETNNEPSYVTGTTSDTCASQGGTVNLPALATWQQATYNAIRNAGNSAPILMNEPGGGVPGTVGAYTATAYQNLGSPMTPSVYSSMTNIIWNLSYYGYASGYSTTQSTVNSYLIGSNGNVATCCAAQSALQAVGILAAQTITSANGTVPVIIGQYGLSTNGSTADANGQQVVQAVATEAQGAYAAGATAWNWNATDCCNNLTSGNNTIVPGYGTQVQSYVNAPTGVSKILMVGDSVTAGGGTCCNGGPPPGAYRSPFEVALANLGYKILLVGDQTYNGNTPTLPYYQSDYEGIGGYAIFTTAGDTNNPGIMTYIQNNNILPDYAPNIVTILIGYNNIYSAPPANLGPAGAFTSLQTMINDIFAALPNVHIIVSTLPATSGDAGVPTSNPNSSSELGYYNYLILNNLTAAINNPNLSVVDSNGAENNANGGPAQFIGPDGIHPNIAGSNAIGTTFAAGVQKVLGEALVVNAVSNQTSGVPFTVSGTIAGVTLAPTLQYCNAGGAWASLPTGYLVTDATFSFTNPALNPVSSTNVSVRDATNTSVVATSNNFSVTASSGGPSGISTPANLLTYLKSIAGNHIISGQFVENQPGSAPPYNFPPIQTIQSETGQWLGMIGLDSTIGGGTIFDNTPANSYAIPYWKAGGLIEMNYFAPNPQTGNNLHDLTVPTGGWGDVVTPGTVANTNYVNNLNSLASQLQVYQAAGVVVMLRQMVELNGNWNWWGTSSCCGGPGSGITSAQAIAIWQYTWNYLTVTKGLSNLVWIYAVNACGGGAGASCEGNMYPGAQYVDIIGWDIYSDTPGQTSQGDYNYFSAGYGKPLSYAEFGSGAAGLGDTSFPETTLISQIQQYTPNVVMWQQWWSGNGGNAGWGMDSLTNTSALSSALNNPVVINRGQINCTTCGSGSGVITWNPGDTSPTITLSNGNLTATGSSAAIGGSRDTVSYSTGNECVEIEASTVTSSMSVGIANSSEVFTGATRTPGNDSNAIAFYPVGGTPQSVFFNGVQELTGTVAALPSGNPITMCMNFTSNLFWVSTPTQRAAGYPWNQSSTANPATSTGGLSMSGLTCPCFVFFDTQDIGSVVTLNATGPFAVSLPSGFSAWQPSTQTTHHPVFIQLGQNDNHSSPANDNSEWAWYRPVSYTARR